MLYREFVYHPNRSYNFQLAPTFILKHSLSRFFQVMIGEEIFEVEYTAKRAPRLNMYLIIDLLETLEIK